MPWSLLCTGTTVKRVNYITGNLWNSWKTISFSIRILVHAVHKPVTSGLRVTKVPTIQEDVAMKLNIQFNSKLHLIGSLVTEEMSTQLHLCVPVCHYWHLSHCRNFFLFFCNGYFGSVNVSAAASCKYFGCVIFVDSQGQKYGADLYILSLILPVTECCTPKYG
jgi:hypothetical protein